MSPTLAFILISIEIVAAVAIIMSRLGRMERNQMADFAELEETVAGLDDVIESAETLIEGIPQMITDAVAAHDAGDAEAVSNLVADLTARKEALAAAVAANTPAAPVAE